MRRLLTTREVMEVLGLTQGKLLRLVHTGQIKASRIGKGFKFRPENVDRYIEENEV